MQTSPSYGVRWHWTLMYLNCSPENTPIKKCALDVELKMKTLHHTLLKTEVHESASLLWDAALPLFFLQLLKQCSHELGLFQKSAFLSFLQLLISFLIEHISQNIIPYHDTENCFYLAFLSGCLRKPALTWFWGTFLQNYSPSPNIDKAAKDFFIFFF